MGSSLNFVSDVNRTKANYSTSIVVINSLNIKSLTVVDKSMSKMKKKRQNVFNENVYIREKFLLGCLTRFWRRGRVCTLYRIVLVSLSLISNYVHIVVTCQLWSLLKLYISSLGTWNYLCILLAHGARGMHSQSRRPVFKTTGWLQNRPSLYFFEVDKMNTRYFWELRGKK